METLDRLTREEDGMLRRLHFFERSGAHLALPYRSLKQSLVMRDLRKSIRDPFEGRVTDASTSWRSLPI